MKPGTGQEREGGVWQELMDKQGGQLRGHDGDSGAHRSLLQTREPLDMWEREQLHRELARATETQKGRGQEHSLE